MMQVLWPRGFCPGFGKNPKFWQTRGESCRGGGCGLCSSGGLGGRMLTEEGFYYLAHSDGVSSALSSQTLSTNAKVPRLYHHLFWIFLVDSHRLNLQFV